MNLTQFLPKFVGQSEDADNFDDLSPEEQAQLIQQEKDERREFHFRSVRNGPASWRHETSGTQRRRAARDRKTLERKTNERHRKAFFVSNLRIAALRGQLQVASNMLEATPALRDNATRALIADHGSVEEAATVLRTVLDKRRDDAKRAEAAQQRRERAAAGKR